MHWNYRIIFTEDKTNPEDSQFGIHEVHYDDDGKPAAYIENPASMIWFDALLNGSSMLEHMRVALTKPMLRPEDFTGNMDDV